jgi:hypothetical protein
MTEWPRSGRSFICYAELVWKPGKRSHRRFSNPLKWCPDRPCAALANIWRWCLPQRVLIRRVAPFVEPSFDLGQIPHDAARCQEEALGKLAALFHLVDRRVGEWHDLAKFWSTDHALEHVGRRLKPPGAALDGLDGGWLRSVGGQGPVFLRNRVFAFHVDRPRSQWNDCDQGDAHCLRIEDPRGGRAEIGGHRERNGRWARATPRPLLPEVRVCRFFESALPVAFDHPLSTSSGNAGRRRGAVKPGPHRTV